MVSISTDWRIGLEESLQELHEVYEEVDHRAKKLEAVHRGRLQCGRGCSDCCIDGMTVFEIEGENIRSHHSDLLVNESPHPEGRCALLDGNGACRVYENRPYVCRTQGLPLRWIEEEAEFQDICPLNEEGSPVEELPAIECWEIGPFEARLASMQAKLDGGALRRVPLRELFIVKNRGSEDAG